MIKPTVRWRHTGPVFDGKIGHMFRVIYPIRNEAPSLYEQMICAPMPIGTELEIKQNILEGFAVTA